MSNRGRLARGGFTGQRGPFAEGTLSFSTEELAQLPRVPNAMDEDFNMIGLWGELTVARHVFKKVPHGDGDLVVDFVDGVQSMTDVVD